MEQDTYKTKVIFRKWKTNGDIIALFPEEPGDLDPYTCNSYEHIGQHGAADPDLIYYTDPATPAEYADLKEELESLGYNLDICRRYTYKMQERRKAALLRQYQD